MASSPRVRCSRCNDLSQLVSCQVEPKPPGDPGKNEETAVPAAGRFPRRTATKANTRRRLVSAALTLFAEKGYEQTTVTEITMLAGAATRTFFFHFPTKADVLFNVPPENLTLLYDLVLTQPSTHSDGRALETAVREWLLQTTLDRAVPHRMTGLLLQAAATSAALRGRQLDYNQMLADLAAEALAKRRDQSKPSLVSLTAARTVMRVLHAIMIDWAESNADDLEGIIDSHFQALHELFVTDHSAKHLRVAASPGNIRTPRTRRSAPLVSPAEMDQVEVDAGGLSAHPQRADSDAVGVARQREQNSRS